MVKILKQRKEIEDVVNPLIELCLKNVAIEDELSEILRLHKKNELNEDEGTRCIILLELIEPTLKQMIERKQITRYEKDLILDFLEVKTNGGIYDN